MKLKIPIKRGVKPKQVKAQPTTAPPSHIIKIDYKTNYELLLSTAKAYGSVNVSSIDNILLIGCHLTNKLKDSVVINNISKFISYVKLVIVAYSVEAGLDSNIYEQSIRQSFPTMSFIFIKDTINLHQDFGKYYLGSYYCTKMIKEFNWLFVTNDSVIYGDISYNINKVITDTENSCRAIVAFPRDDRMAYQSWWLNFKQSSFYYWMNNITLTTPGRVAAIVNNEIELSQKLIEKFKATTTSEIVHSGIPFLFSDMVTYISLLTSNKFNIVKLRHLPEYSKNQLNVVKQKIPNSVLKVLNI